MLASTGLRGEGPATTPPTRPPLIAGMQVFEDIRAEEPGGANVRA